MRCDFLQWISPISSCLSGSEGLDHADGRTAGSVVASCGVLSEGYGHDGPGVRLVDGQTEAYLKDNGHGGPGVFLGDGQREAYLEAMGMAGLASAWAKARRRPKVYRRNVDAATRFSGVCPHM